MEMKERKQGLDDHIKDEEQLSALLSACFISLTPTHTHSLNYKYTPPTHTYSSFLPSFALINENVEHGFSLPPPSLLSPPLLSYPRCSRLCSLLCRDPESCLCFRR